MTNSEEWRSKYFHVLAASTVFAVMNYSAFAKSPSQFLGGCLLFFFGSALMHSALFNGLTDKGPFSWMTCICAVLCLLLSVIVMFLPILTS